MPKSTLLNFENVSRNFGDVVALKNVNLEIYENEFFGLLGPSGCGKTTLLRILAGLDDPNSGSILLDGKDLVNIPAHKRPINLMFQSYALFPHLNVRRNVSYGLEREKLPADEIYERTNAALDVVGLRALDRRRPSELSGGQRQRVALARAMIKRPRLLLLDEPLAALDKQIRLQMQTELKRLQLEVGITFVVVTHDQEEAMSMADRVAILRDGQLQQVGSPTELYETPCSRFVAQFIGQTNLFDVNQLGDWLELRNGVKVARSSNRIDGELSLTLSVRPERIFLTGSEKMTQSSELARNNELTGVVTDVQFGGGISHCMVDVAGLQKSVMVTTIGSPSVESGQSVIMSWNPQHSVELIL